MENLENYREYIQSILTDYAESKTSHNSDDKLEMQTIFDLVFEWILFNLLVCIF